MLPGIAVPGRLTVGGAAIDGDVGAHVAAELDAGVGAGNVEEACAIERADLHIFDRLGLDRKVGGLCAADHGEAGRGCQDEAMKRPHEMPSAIQAPILAY
jgi:hypothetical protein